MNIREAVRAATTHWDENAPGTPGHLPWLAAILDEVSNTRTGEVRLHPCPDGGTCHHECGRAECFRVHSCAPFSGLYKGDQWPDSIVFTWKPGGVL